MSTLGEQEGASNRLRDRTVGWGASLVGFTDLRGMLSPTLSRWPSAVSIALALDSRVMAGLRDGPTVEYYAEYKRVNLLLNEIAERGAYFISSLGYDAEAFPATIVDSSPGDEFDRTLSVAFQHKTAATCAGLGWIGKSALLVTLQYGPRVRLATIFTDMPLGVGTPVITGHCGKCKACLVACPAGAIKGREWQAGLARDELVDAHACRAKAKQLLLERVGAQDSVCGVCVSVCPIGKS
jgi:epoxyqueuosine reductase